MLAMTAASCGENDSSDDIRDSSLAEDPQSSESTPSSPDSSEASPESSLSDASSQDESSQAGDEREPLLDKLPQHTFSNKTVRIIASRRIDPDSEDGKTDARWLFDRKYGGTAEFTFTAGDDRYQTLSAMKNAGSTPDLFSADEGDTFPRGVSGDLFMPLNNYLDLDSELWQDTKMAADHFVLADKSYTAVIEVLPKYALVYDRRIISEDGLDDPAELFDQGKWDQTAFDRLCRSFTGSSLGRKAFGGAVSAKAFSEGSGFPLFGVSGGTVQTYYDEDALAATQNFMYSLGQAGLYAGDIEARGLGDGTLLFFAAEMSQLEELDNSDSLFREVPADELMFVPVPCYDSEHPSVSARIRGYHIVAGSSDPEAAAAYLECEKAVCDRERGKTEEWLMSEAGWSSDMIKMRRSMSFTAQHSPVISCAEGISFEAAQSNDTVIAMSLRSAEQALTWESTVDEYRNQLDYLAMKADDAAPTGP